MMYFKYISYWIFLTLLSFCFLGVIAQQTIAQGGSTVREKVITCFTVTHQEDREYCYNEICAENDPSMCVESIVRSAALLDAGFAMAVLQQVSQSPYITGDWDESDVLTDRNEFDGYYFARVIGETAFQHADRSSFGDTLISCTPSFNHGCYHGFFNGIVSTSNIALEDIPMTVCGAMPEPVSQAVCYRAAAYLTFKNNRPFLHQALSACDIWEPSTKKYCYDGVFIENTYAFLNASSSDSPNTNELAYGFRESYPLAPCQLIGETYREACYRTHGRYLLHFFEGGSFDPAEICANAGQYEAVCRQSVADAHTTVEREQSQEFDTSTLTISKMSDISGTWNKFTTRSWWQRIVDFIVGLFFSAR